MHRMRKIPKKYLSRLSYTALHNWFSHTGRRSFLKMILRQGWLYIYTAAHAREMTTQSKWPSRVLTLLHNDVLATGFWATRISEITEKDTVLLIGAGPTGICTLLCSMLKNPKRIIVCEKSPERIQFVREHYPDVLITTPENCKEFVLQNSDHGGADVVLEVAGTEDSFRMAWDCARPNAIVTIVALYDKPLLFPLPEMYGKNLTFKTGGVDGCDCAEILSLIEEGKIDTTPLITHRCSLNEIEEAYRIFENKLDGVIKVAIVCQTESNK